MADVSRIRQGMSALEITMLACSASIIIANSGACTAAAAATAMILIVTNANTLVASAPLTLSSNSQSWRGDRVASSPS